MTTVYRFYNDDDLWEAGEGLLYIGISDCPEYRFKQHAAEKPWWPEVKRITVEEELNRRWARAVERWAIAVYKPRYNIADQVTHDRPHLWVWPDGEETSCECVDCGAFEWLEYHRLGPEKKNRDRTEPLEP